MWTESPNNPDEAWIKSSRNGDSHQPSKDNIQGENDLKFQISRELYKTSKVNTLKEVKTRDYRERP